MYACRVAPYVYFFFFLFLFPFSFSFFFFQIQCNRVQVTVIDDREGRDMPLLRAEAGNLDMTHERGPGMARCGLHTASLPCLPSRLL